MKLSSPLRSITATSNATATTTEPSFAATYIDRFANQDDNPGDSVGALNGASPVTIVPATAVSACRDVESFVIFNRDTVTHTITLAKVHDGTSYTFAKASLGADESLHYNGRELHVITANGEVKATTMGAATAAAGTKNGATVVASEAGYGPFHQTTLTCTATPVAIADDAGVAQYGGAGKIYDFPEGAIAILGAVIDGSVTLGTTGTITNTWGGGIALGSAAATTGATLTGTEADVMAEVNVAAATAKVASVDAVSAATGLTILDGTTTALDLFLNLVVDDDATHTAGTGTFTGTVTFSWVLLGDKA